MESRQLVINGKLSVSSQPLADYMSVDKGKFHLFNLPMYGGYVAFNSFEDFVADLLQKPAPSPAEIDQAVFAVDQIIKYVDQELVSKAVAKLTNHAEWQALQQNKPKSHSPTFFKHQTSQQVPASLKREKKSVHVIQQPCKR